MNSPIQYRLGRGDVIEDVNDAWVSFARDNGAPELLPERVLGQTVWTFVHGPAVQYMWQLIFGRARQERAALRLPYRCDAPRTRRYLEMEVSAPDGVLVTCTSRTVWEESRPAVEWFVQDRDPSDEHLIMCSWCNRARLHQRWVEIEQAIDELHLFDRRLGAPISHGICEACVQKVLR